MIEINPSRWVQNPPPLPHQLTGVKALVTHKAFFLGDRPRTMKSRQVVDAACTLYEAGEIDLVVVIAPVSGRGVWGNAKLGQVKRWSWKRARVFEFHQKQRDLWKDERPELTWVVTNYDFVRSEKHLKEFLARLGNYKSVMLVFDESKALGNHTSLQSKMAMQLRWSPFVSRCVMLNGTPGGPYKQWSQFNILDHVFDRRHKSFITFKWRYTKYGPLELKTLTDKDGKVIRNKEGKPVWQKAIHAFEGYKNLDKLSKITAPYCLMRERKDCPGLKDVPVVSSFKEVQLSKESWRMYRELKREAIIALSSGEMYVSANAGVRLMRLSQLCSGHLGGFEEGEATRWLSDEKVDWLVEELKDSEIENVLVWCHFTLQRKRVAELLAQAGFTVHQFHGGQKREERKAAEFVFAEDAVRCLGRHAMIAQPQAGGMAVDFSAASDVYRMSSDYNWETFAQSNDRPLGPAQKAEFVSSTDIVATGPDGQRTMDHVVLEAREEKRNLERQTTQWWRTELEAE